MREPRHVVEKKGRYLVPIPAGVREHLGVVKGAQVWWHTTRKGEAALTSGGSRPGGRTRLDADCPACAAFRDEATRLRAMLRTTTVVDYNTAFGQGYQQGVKSVPIWRAELDTLHAEVNDMRRLLAQLVTRLPERRTPRRRGGVAARPVDAVPLPDLPSSPVLAGGDVASGGAAPPGHPQDT